MPLIHFAAQNKDGDKVCRALIYAGGYTNIVDRDGQTALDHAYDIQLKMKMMKYVADCAAASDDEDY